MNRKMYKMVVRQAMLCGFEEERTEERMGAELEEAEMKLLVTSFWEQQGWRGSRTRTSERQHMLDVLEVKSKRSDGDVLNTS